MALTKKGPMPKGPLPIGATKDLPKMGTKEAKALSAKKPAKKTTPAGAKAAAKATGEKGTFEGYCVKCKEKGVSFEGEIFEGATGNRIAKGPHEKCGTTVCRILGKAK